MTVDLAGTPVSGLRVQLCGDAHLANFGAFASPARRLVFDINDFDETLPGPFEWDVKRLAASFAVAGRENGFSAKERRAITPAVAGSYRTAMRDFAGRPGCRCGTRTWTSRRRSPPTVPSFQASGTRHSRRCWPRPSTRDSEQAMRKLTTVVDGQTQIVSDPPHHGPDRGAVRRRSSPTRSTTCCVPSSVSTAAACSPTAGACWSSSSSFRRPEGRRGRQRRHSERGSLLLEDDDHEPMFLQAKQAQPSVLADYCGRSQYRNQGERVVAGQHLMQALSDIFLGWTPQTVPDGVDRDYYVRQLRDWKFSFPIEQMLPEGMSIYAHLCALDPRPRARPLGRPGGVGRLSRWLERIRSCDRRVRRDVRGPERP